MIYGQPITFGSGGKSTIPGFSYSGAYALKTAADYGLKGNYQVLALLSSGNLVFSEEFDADVFMVGGGESGDYLTYNSSGIAAKGAGAGGYTTTATTTFPASAKECVIGSGGESSTSGRGAGGSTYIPGVGFAQGGGSIASGNGGSGAGGGACSTSQTSGIVCNGGDDGSNGTGKISGWDGTDAGVGQNHTTRAFGEAGAAVFAGGGASGCVYGSSSSNSTYVAGTPGTGGGEVCRGVTKPSDTNHGAENTGSGGGGRIKAKGISSASILYGGNGGSGIILIRPKQ